MTAEDTLLRRWSGLKILLASLGLAVACALPLQLYIWFGPEDGNPIGLGLLFMLAVPIAIVGGIVGLLKMAWEFFTRR